MLYATAGFTSKKNARCRIASSSCARGPIHDRIGSTERAHDELTLTRLNRQRADARVRQIPLPSQPTRAAVDRDKQPAFGPDI